MIDKKIEDNEERIQRVLEILPGFMIWVLLLAPFWAGRAFPLVVADFLIILSIYWFYRAALTTIGATIGLIKHKRAVKKDWLEECNKLSEYELEDPQTLPVGQLLPKHLIVYPQLLPQFAVLKTTLDGLRKQNYPKELMYIAISFEERAIKKNPDIDVEGIQQQVKDEFPEFSERLMFFIHPDGIEGEAIGAAANRAWGARNAVDELEKRGEVISDFLVTSPDEDIVFHPEFLAACSYQYLTSEKRQQKFYQTALYTFNNNYWQVPMLIRVLVSSLTIPVLSSSVIEVHKRETFSCYTISLDVLKKVDYWDTSYGIDDTPFYWRPYFYFDGDWECRVFFVPLSADAIYNPSYIQNHRDQYKQYVRWGWGVIAFPIGMKGLLKDNTIPFMKRLSKIIHLFEVFIFWKVLAYLLTFTIPILLFLNPQLNESIVWYTLPNTISSIMGLAVLFLIPSSIYKAIIAPKKPSDWSKFKYTVVLIIEAPLNIITLFLYSTLPFVEAATRLMIGQKESKSVTWSTKVR